MMFNYRKYFYLLVLVLFVLSPFTGFKDEVSLKEVGLFDHNANQAMELRLVTMPEVKTIIDEALIELQNWAQEIEVSSTIQWLKNTLDQFRQEELAPYLKGRAPQKRG